MVFFVDAVEFRLTRIVPHHSIITRVVRKISRCKPKTFPSVLDFFSDYLVNKMVVKLVGPQSDRCFLLFCIKAIKYSSAPTARMSPVALTRETC